MSRQSLIERLGSAPVGAAATVGDLLDLMDARAGEVLEQRGDLSFHDMRGQNASRLVRWHGEPEEDDWTCADWSNAMAGEAGEAANVVKKLRLIESGHWARTKYPGDSGPMAAMTSADAKAQLTTMLKAELADVVLYADLLAHHMGIDLASAVREKFNRVSEAQEFPERL